jgi:hypothetical protein
VKRLQEIAKWVSEEDRWRWLLLAVMLFIGLPVVISNLLYPSPLSDRRYRTEIFDLLVAEQKAIEIPEKTAVYKSEAGHKASSILISTRYRTELGRKEFFQLIDSSLSARGWIRYDRRQEEIAIRSFHYCRRAQDATLYLESKSLFDSDKADYWKLFFTAGLRSGSIFGGDSLPASCRE